MNNLIVTGNAVNKNAVVKLKLTVLNENQEMNYCEWKSGTVNEIVNHAVEILKGLHKLLTQGEFTIKVQDMSFSNEWYVTLEGLFNSGMAKIKID